MDHSKTGRDPDTPRSPEAERVAARLFVTVPGGREAPVSNHWIRFQASGLAAGLFACLAVWLVIGGPSAGDFAVSVVVTVVYSLSIGGLIAATLPVLPDRIRSVPSPRNWLVFLLFILMSWAKGLARRC